MRREGGGGATEGWQRPTGTWICGRATSMNIIHNESPDFVFILLLKTIFMRFFLCILCFFFLLYYKDK